MLYNQLLILIEYSILDYDQVKSSSKLFYSTDYNSKLILLCRTYAICPDIQKYRVIKGYLCLDSRRTYRLSECSISANTKY